MTTSCPEIVTAMLFKGDKMKRYGVSARDSSTGSLVGGSNLRVVF